MLALKRLTLLSFLLLVSVVSTKADAVLLGSVSFDPGTNLYTYSYTIDNTTGPAPITILTLRFDGTPVSHTSPANWLFTTGQQVNLIAPVNMSGSIITWQSENGLRTGGIPVGSVLGGFSITTPFAPLTTGGNNFVLVGLNYNGGPPQYPDFAAYGHVVAPATVPEPATLLLLGMGLAGLVSRLKRGGKRE